MATANPPLIVLVRPQLGQNIGKSARAMLNFGLTELRLVSPRDGWPNPDAGPAASGADIVLERAEVFATVAEAIADCTMVYASTVRPRELSLPVLSPRAMAEAMAPSNARTAILFGPERAGLETDEAALANAIVTVPVNPGFGSLNLAQAVIVLAYEWSQHARGDSDGDGPALVQPPLRPLEAPATHGELDQLVGQLGDALEAKNYYFPPERARSTNHVIRSIVAKAGWSSREAKAVRGIIRALSSPPRRRSPP